MEGSKLVGGFKYLSYVFSMSARDMARFGYLYLRQGLWRARQVVPARWVTRSIMAYSNQAGRPSTAITSYGRRGTGATPPWGMAGVHRVRIDPPGEDFVSDAMIRLIMAAAPASQASGKQTGIA